MKLFDEEEFDRWRAQAEQTLRSAEHDLQAGDFNWSCFKAQQAAEYALKGLSRGLGKGAPGHSLLRLLEDLERSGFSLTPGIREQARSLDRHYIPARYPNAYASGAPFEFYDEGTAQEALASARHIVEFVCKEKEKLVSSA